MAPSEIAHERKVLVNMSELEGHKVVTKISRMFVPLPGMNVIYMIFAGAGGLLSVFIGSGVAFVHSG